MAPDPARPDREPRGAVAGHGDAAGLLPVEEARDRILARIAPLPPVALPLADAHGCVLAEDAEAPIDLPPFPSSAMDGFAVRSADVWEASRERPVRLRIDGEAEMGRAPTSGVQPGGAVKISTGAPIPPGADAVAPIEDCAEEEERVLVFGAPEPGAFVRPAGQDARSGDVLVEAGRRLGAPELGLLASAGRARARVRPRPRVLVVSTGQELVAPGEAPGPGQIYDANGFTLTGAVLEAGATPVGGGTLADDPGALRHVIQSHRDRTDAVVSSGGVSMGERDPVRLAYAGTGEVEFWRVAMQPGMPQAFGMIGGRPFFGLPGNPVSVFVSFELFVRPALLKMMDRRHLFRPEVTAVMETDVEGLPTEARFARVRVTRGPEGWRAGATGDHHSNLLSTVSRANGLAIIAPGTEKVAAGEPCRVLLFRHLED